MVKINTKNNTLILLSLLLSVDCTILTLKHNLRHLTANHNDLDDGGSDVST